MTKTQLLLIPAAVLALGGCFMSQQSQLVHRDVPYNAQSQARLRIYGQYGRDVVRMIPNSSCEQWAEKQGRRRHTRFTGGLPRRIRNFRSAFRPLSAAPRWKQTPALCSANRIKNLSCPPASRWCWTGRFPPKPPVSSANAASPPASRRRPAKITKCSILAVEAVAK